MAACGAPQRWGALTAGGQNGSVGTHSVGVVFCAPQNGSVPIFRAFCGGRLQEPPWLHFGAIWGIDAGEQPSGAQNGDPGV